MNRAALTLVLALGLGTLGACGEDAADAIAENAAENAVERAAGEDVDIDIDEGGGDVSVTTGDGSFSATTGELPDGFPDIPLLDGEIISAVAVDQGADSGWSVSMQLDGEAEQRLDEAIALLVGAGFTTDENSRVPGLVAAQVSDDELDVFLTVLPGDGVTVQYTVTPAP